MNEVIEIMERLAPLVHEVSELKGDDLMPIVTLEYNGNDIELLIYPDDWKENGVYHYTTSTTAQYALDRGLPIEGAETAMKTVIEQLKERKDD